MSFDGASRKAEILTCLQQQDMTALEIAKAIHRDCGPVSSYLSYLHGQGIVHRTKAPTGKRGRTPNRYSVRAA